MSPALRQLGGSEEKSATSERGDHAIEHENDNDNVGDDEDDYTSSEGTSSSSSSEGKDDDEDDENEDEESETITYIPGRPKPQISLPPTSSDLLSRISSFLPQLQAANADIEQRLAKGESLEDMILDDVKDDEAGEGDGEGKTYIEMVSSNLSRN